jgi:hypothetical protein
MKRRTPSIAVVIGLLSAVVIADVASAHPTVLAGPTNAPPSADFSTSGDYATDILGDPWDFSNSEDVPPIQTVGTEGSFGISVSGGLLTVDAQAGSTIKLVRSWGQELPWGRDGLLKPIDAAVYKRLSFSMSLTEQRNMGVQFFSESGLQCIVPFLGKAGGSVYDIDLNAAGLGGCQTGWTGKIIRLQILAGGANPGPGSARFPIFLDWVRLRRSDASVTPEGSPVVRVLTPSDVGGADYATVSGNAWDFAAADDVVTTGDIVNGSFDGSNYNGTTIRNDPFVELPLRTPLIPDRYHRATVSVCYDGPFSFANAPGGGMVARFAWFDEGGQIWSETQDIIIYPGCNAMTIDLATNPAGAVNDENTIYKAGWRGIRISAIRFDLNEDPGVRNFSLQDIRLADDAAFSSGNFPISFDSSTGGTAELFASTESGTWNGTPIGTMAVQPGANTFQWNGNGLTNGTYYVWVRVTNGNAKGSAYSTGPVRIERPVPSTRSYYVPLNPTRLLDTRDGTGGNISALSGRALTELKVAGVGGVPNEATAVVLNVTVDAPFTAGFITAWPSGEAIPTVSNLNFVPGQTVPNLVTVKVGANGRVNLYNSEGYTQLVADVVGYYTATPPPSGGLFTALTPKRLLDTRLGAGIPVAGGTAINLAVTGGATTVPPGASGVALNVTVDQPTGPGYLTVWPTGEQQPLASSHNFVPGLTVANMVLAKVGSGGQVSIFNSFGATHVIVDVVGYFSASGGVFIPVSPQRIADSRFGLGTGVNGPLGQGQSVNVAVGTVAPAPPGATAAIVNVTSVDSTEQSFITVWPTGTAEPTASTLNPRVGVPVPNLAYLLLGTGGKLSIYNNSGSTQYIVDVFGYVVR